MSVMPCLLVLGLQHIKPTIQFSKLMMVPRSGRMMLGACCNFEPANGKHIKSEHSFIRADEKDFEFF